MSERGLDVRAKLKVLADAAKYDASCASSGGKRSASQSGVGSVTGEGICHSYTPDGRCVSLLKVLLTNHCIYDCKFCVNRLSSDTPRARFEVKELVTLFLEFYRRNYVEGLFLSSGIIKSVDYTMERLIDVARSLRVEHNFRGYIHLKIVPGASKELTTSAGLYADRLSANVELPSDDDLKVLAPEKSMSAIEGTMSQVRTGIDARESPKAPAFAPAGQSTQMVVGATETPDRRILETATSLYTRHKLRRIYYSAFSPIPSADARLPGKSPPLVREHRLYEADWLIRNYEFKADELTSTSAPNLELERDPKLAWALRNRAFFPIDVNRAERHLMLRVPGFGVRNVDRLISLRRFKAVTLGDLIKLRVVVKRSLPFVVTADHRPKDLDSVALPMTVTPKAVQLSFGAVIGGQL